MGICFGVAYNKPGQEYLPEELSPAYSAAAYFAGYEHREVPQPPSSNVHVVEHPRHGKLMFSTHPDGSLKHSYVPKPGYVGDERLVFKVNVDGKTVRLVYVLKVTKAFTDAAGVHDLLCKKTGNNWKISLRPGLHERSVPS